MIWKCNICEFLNKFEDGSKCQNKAIECKGDVEAIEDIGQFMSEMKQSAYESYLQVQQQDAKKQKEEKPPGEDDWECQTCNHMNKMMPRDIKSAICLKCNTKNTIIEQMISI